MAYCDLKWLNLSPPPRKGYARNPPERSSGEIFVRDWQKMQRNVGDFFFEIFVLQFPGTMAARNFTKNPRHIPTVHQRKFFR